jgi:hypothetical protein
MRPLLLKQLLRKKPEQMPRLREKLKLRPRLRSNKELLMR